MQSAPHSSVTRRAVRDRLQRGDGASVPRAIEGLGARLSPEGDFSSNANSPGAHLLGNVKRGRKTRFEGSTRLTHQRPSLSQCGAVLGPVQLPLPVHKAHIAPRCTAKSKRTGNRCRAPPCEAGRFAGCTALAVAHRRANAMEITGTGPARKKRPSFGSSLNRCAERMLSAFGGKADMVVPEDGSRTTIQKTLSTALARNPLNSGSFIFKFRYKSTLQAFRFSIVLSRSTSEP